MSDENADRSFENPPGVVAAKQTPTEVKKITIENNSQVSSLEPRGRRGPAFETEDLSRRLAFRCGFGLTGIHAEARPARAEPVGKSCGILDQFRRDDLGKDSPVRKGRQQEGRREREPAAHQARS